MKKLQWTCVKGGLLCEGGSPTLLVDTADRRRYIRWHSCRMVQGSPSWTSGLTQRTSAVYTISWWWWWWAVLAINMAITLVRDNIQRQCGPQMYNLFSTFLIIKVLEAYLCTLLSPRLTCGSLASSRAALVCIAGILSAEWIMLCTNADHWWSISEQTGVKYLNIQQKLSECNWWNIFIINKTCRLHLQSLWYKLMKNVALINNEAAETVIHMSQKC